MNTRRQITSLNFALEVEDGWPPVATECLQFEKTGLSHTLLVAPLFIEDLSVGDELQVVSESEGIVHEWRHLRKSRNSTVWFLRIGEVDVEPLLKPIQELGCNTTWSSQLGAGSIEVPEGVSVEAIDACLETLEIPSLTLAFPAWRHTDG